MAKATLLAILERRGFSHSEADAVVSGLTAVMVEAARRKPRVAIAGLCGGVIGSGLATIALTATLATFAFGAPIDAFTGAMQSEITGFRESVAAQIAEAKVDTQVQLHQGQAHLNRIETRIGALADRLATVQKPTRRRGYKLESLGSKIDGLAHALEKPSR